MAQILVAKLFGNIMDRFFANTGAKTLEFLANGLGFGNIRNLELRIIHFFDHKGFKVLTHKGV
jgi:hypothetical protein